MEDIACRSEEGTTGEPPDPEGPHDIAPRERWPWLPTHRDHGLAQHPYCEECGAVKVIGQEAGLDFGTLVNMLADLARRVGRSDEKITETQKRLILRRLKAEKADDGFAVPRSRQIDLLAEAVQTYTTLDRKHVQTILRSC